MKNHTTHDETMATALENALSEQKEHYDDPLSAIKSMRLEQLTACRLKSAKEIEKMERIRHQNMKRSE